MIEIQEINTRSIENIVNRLLDEKAQPFEIYVPKSTLLFASSHSDIANDYAMLAYAGQKLSEVANGFSYHYISPSNHESILFKVNTDNVQQLAETILIISYGYDNESVDEVCYLDEVYDFIEKVASGEITPACPDFIKDYQEYNESAGKENNVE